MTSCSSSGGRRTSGSGWHGNARKGSLEEVQEQADVLVGVLQQIVIGMRDVQSLFRSSRRRRQVLKVEPILDKIHAIYAGLLEKLEITYNKSVVGTTPLVANAPDGVLMQVIINLFDNAAYWLDTKAPSAPREIRVTLDGDAGKLVFGDNGPGVDGEDKSYIFEAFFSGKGQEGPWFGPLHRAPATGAVRICNRGGRDRPFVVGRRRLHCDFRGG